MDKILRADVPNNTFMIQKIDDVWYAGFYHAYHYPHDNNTYIDFEPSCPIDDFNFEILKRLLDTIEEN